MLDATGFAYDNPATLVENDRQALRPVGSMVLMSMYALRGTKMDVRQIAADLSVTGQIEIEDVAALRTAGFKSIICNRPDNEEAGQTPADVLRAAILAAGLEHRSIPVSGAFGVSPDNVEATIAALDELPRPILAYCRSGARSTNLYQMAIMRGAKP